MNSPTKVAFAAAATALALTLSACGSSDPSTGSGSGSGSGTSADASTSASSAPTSAGTGASAAATITIKDFAYGTPLTVAPGTTVTVINEDSAPHNANDKGGAFSEPLLAPGESATFVAPSTDGTYDLICTKHPQMAGELTVAG